MQHSFHILLLIMTVLAVIVFIALHFVDAGYGRFYNKKWGPSINNKLGWIVMEAPVFVMMLVLWLVSNRVADIPRLVFLLFFQIHYFQRSFIFPFRLRGKSSMAISVVAIGVVFNLLNAVMQGGWIFYVSPSDYYTLSWLWSPQFVIGTLVFFMGMIINQQSDNIIRNLRKNGNETYHLPQKGMFKYVTSANYFGELVEWIGFAILTWSWAGAVFAVWTFANLAPRAAKIHEQYKRDYPDQIKNSTLKCIIPFIY